MGRISTNIIFFAVILSSLTMSITAQQSVSLKEVQVGDVVICGSRSVVYLTSNYHSRFVVEGNSELQEAMGAHLWILRKTVAGVWRVAIVAWSSWEPRNC